MGPGIAGGLLHRDLKPSNILVTEIEGRPTPKIIDFGIAKAIDQPLTDSTLITGRGLIGTPGYLSPEAVEHGGQEVDTRTDVYALGVLLVGVRPFAITDEPACPAAICTCLRAKKHQCPRRPDR